MSLLYYALFVGGIVAADQFTKYLTVANIALYEDVPFIPGLLQLTYVQNTGAAFSSFEGQQWLFALIFALFTGIGMVDERLVLGRAWWQIFPFDKLGFIG